MIKHESTYSFHFLFYISISNTQLHPISFVSQSIQSAMLQAKQRKVEVEALILKHCKSIKDQEMAHVTTLTKNNSQLHSAGEEK